jgi:Dolichyl-phosphate-mannose-protein mannosyltransferase
MLPRHGVGARWRASSLDDRLGLLVTFLALAVAASTGISHSFAQPVYGPIDEVSHTAYAFHVGKFGVPPVLGRDRAFIGRKGVPLGSRDVDIPKPEKASAPIPISPDGAFGQPEAIQPPLYYYVIAPITWFSSGTAAVVAMRLAGVLMILVSILLAFLAVFDLTEDSLAAGFAAMILATMPGVVDFLSEVQNDALLLPLGGALFWLVARGMRARALTWPLAACAAGLSITQIVGIPLGAIALLAVGALEVLSARTRLSAVALRIGVAAVPLALWVASNVVRYGTLLPRNVTAAPGLFRNENEQILHLHEYGFTVFNAIIGGSYLHLYASPYGADYRFLSILMPAVMGGTGVVCAFRSERYRLALGFAYVMVAVTMVVIYLADAASLIGTGGDLAALAIHRYYMPTIFAGACLAGIATGGLATRQWTHRALLLVLPLIFAYWALNGSTLTGA